MTDLKARLAELRAEKDAARNPEWTAIMDRSTEVLIDSNFVAGVPRVGDRAPLFARPNLDGDLVRLSSLLDRGPVLVSFFRGRW
ncbi:MAG: hypothetical protein AAF389_03010 [Gemmatimonadota bacterium]